MATGTGTPPPGASVDKQKSKIRALFDEIAPRYDLLNRLLSFNIDGLWRRKAVAAIDTRDGGIYLDACCGTGDMTRALLRRKPRDQQWQVIGSDFSLEMLRRGKRRRGAGKNPVIAGDTLQLPFAGSTFDGVVVGFGIRNLEGLENGLKELCRVLRPGGKLVILEFTPMQHRLLRPLFEFYLHRVLPTVGNFISRSKGRAYSYLDQSVREWPDGETLAKRMRSAGFDAVRWQTLKPGNVALHEGIRA